MKMSNKYFFFVIFNVKFKNYVWNKNCEQKEI